MCARLNRTHIVLRQAQRKVAEGCCVFDGGHVALGFPVAFSHPGYPSDIVLMVKPIPVVFDQGQLWELCHLPQGEPLWACQRTLFVPELASFSCFVRVHAFFFGPASSVPSVCSLHQPFGGPVRSERRFASGNRDKAESEKPWRGSRPQIRPGERASTRTGWRTQFVPKKKRVKHEPQHRAAYDSECGILLRAGRGLRRLASEFDCVCSGDRLSEGDGLDGGFLDELIFEGPQNNRQSRSGQAIPRWAGQGSAPLAGFAFPSSRPGLGLSAMAGKQQTEKGPMVGKFYVLAETPDEYTSKRGTVVKSQILTLIDREPDPARRLRQPLDYNLSEDEKEKYAGRLADKELTLAVTELSVFGGRNRARGVILEVPGIPNGTAPKK